eukprot:CAMPEP_0196666322 /NCGR_PEP_ID=MMETSP1086-20130531/64448_1 /TAXON_ID=77921 /ORGANISM="Cyanoptyche  gloeocystis , Strain SAG4.97" /LENGTH=261 /DNA_ID=CAMNT_0042003497 /DNA_START=18 /DNA_END=803 /DNA_ORIENTATION=-
MAFVPCVVSSPALRASVPNIGNTSTLALSSRSKGQPVGLRKLHYGIAVRSFHRASLKFVSSASFVTCAGNEAESRSMSDVMDAEDDDDDALHNVLRNVNEGGVMPGETEFARLSAVAGVKRFQREAKKEPKVTMKPAPVVQEGPRQATVADLLDEDEDSFEHSIFLELNEDSDIPGDATMVEAEARLGALPISRTRTPKPRPAPLESDNDDTVSELDDEEESYEHSIFADLGDDSDIPGDERMIEAEARAGAGVFANKGRK